jgi:hypothetical protein
MEGNGSGLILDLIPEFHEETEGTHEIFNQDSRSTGMNPEPSEYEQKCLSLYRYIQHQSLIFPTIVDSPVNVRGRGKLRWLLLTICVVVRVQ